MKDNILKFINMVKDNISRITNVLPKKYWIQSYIKGAIWFFLLIRSYNVFAPMLMSLLLYPFSVFVFKDLKRMATELFLGSWIAIVPVVILIPCKIIMSLILYTGSIVFGVIGIIYMYLKYVIRDEYFEEFDF